MFCHNCGADLQGRPKFCHKCGRPITQIKPVEEQPTAPEAALPLVEERSESLAEKKPRRPRRVWGCALLLLALAVICGGATTAVYFWLGLHEQNQTVQILPEETAALISLSPSMLQLAQAPDGRNLQAGSVLLAPLLAVPGVFDVLTGIQENIPLNLEIDPVRDIAPWIGREISLAVVPGEVDAAAGANTPILIVTAVTRNPAAASIFLANIRAQMEEEGIQFGESTYADITVTEVVSPTSMPLAYATVDNLVIIATNASALRDAIDRTTAAAPQTLANSPQFEEALAALPGNRLGYVYLDRAALAGEEMSNWGTWEQDALESLAFAFALTGNGLKLDYVARLDRDSLSRPQEEWLRVPAFAPKLIEYVPARALAYFAGQDAELVWEAAADPVWQQEVRRDLNYIPPDLIEGILALAPDEYGLVLMPDSDGLFGREDAPFGLILLAQVERRTQTQDDLSAIAAQMPFYGGFQFEEDEINRTAVYLLQNPVKTIGYGIEDDAVFVGTSEEMLRYAVRAKNSSLAGNENFQAAAADFGELHSLLYVDVREAVRAVNRALAETGQDPIDETLRPFLEPIQSIILMTKPMDENDMIRGVLLIYTE